MVIPLMVWIALLLLAGGMLLFYLGVATNLKTQAQTAADAAALGGEKELMRELQTPVVDARGNYLATQYSIPKITAVANQYAQSNGARVIGPTPGGMVELVQSVAGYDVRVVVATGQTLPKGSPDSGAYAVALARASTDPFASSHPAVSVPVSVSASTGSCTTAGSGSASVRGGNHPAPDRFVPHGGQTGFFPAPGANYSSGCEPALAGWLDRLGKAQKLHLKGVAGARGSASAGGVANDPHSCGQASTTTGIPLSISNSKLLQFSLTRPDPTKPDEIQLAGTDVAVCAKPSTQLDTQNVPTGNPNVHLVPWNGGPQGTFGAGSGFGMVPLGGGWSIPAPIVFCESSGINQPPNGATASGYYQITNGTWAMYGGRSFGYSQANQAPASIQGIVAARIWAGGRGWRNWISSEPCWSRYMPPPAV